MKQDNDFVVLGTPVPVTYSDPDENGCVTATMPVMITSQLTEQQIEDEIQGWIDVLDGVPTILEEHGMVYFEGPEGLYQVMDISIARKVVDRMNQD